MEIRDVVHGSIPIDKGELPILDSRYFQRLRQIKQLGFAEFSFPSATHNRYIHSLGAMHTATQAFSYIFGEALKSQPATFARFRAVTRLAALLHDIGHGPLSHTTEFAMPLARSFGHPVPELVAGAARDEQVTHEDYTLKLILASGLTAMIEKAGAAHGFKPIHVAALIEPRIAIDDDFFKDSIHGEKADFRPILSQLISSELDADRMDYLRRDSLHAGVSYGQYEYEWLVRNLTFHVKGGKAFLALQHRALYSFEDFLISRFHMFLMVYFHYKSVIFDSMLAQYFASPDADYALPADVEKYCDCNDAHLFSHLAKSKDPWAKRITEKRPYRMLVELHSGVPATRMAAQNQVALIEEIETDLKKRKIHYLKNTTTGELSKYFSKGGEHAPIFVRYDNHYSAAAFIPLAQCTDLFQRYSEKRSITRLYVSPEDYPKCRNQGRGSPLRYEEEAPSGI